MKTIKIKTEKELKSFAEENRKSIIRINDVECNELYPMLELSNKHSRYYNVDKQEYSFMYPPFEVTIK